MIGVWLIFLISIALLLAVDLGVFHRDSREVQLREALVLTGIWISLGVAFSSVVYVVYEYRDLVGVAPVDGHGHHYNGWQAVLTYLTAYFIEQSLSFDNIFVIALLFDRFRVAAQHRHRVLFWGVMGAVVIRGLLISSGLWLVAHLTWLFYVFGAYLVWMGVSLVLKKEEAEGADHEPMITRLAKRWLPIAQGDYGERFIVRLNGRMFFTPLAVVLLTIEWTDVVFAVDSIPAVLAISTDNFIIYTSNIFAILGLRSLYFVLSNLMHRFAYLKWSLAVILVFVGLKMVLHTVWHVPNLVSLAVVLLSMLVGILVSLRSDSRQVKA